MSSSMPLDAAGGEELVDCSVRLYINGSLCELGTDDSRRASGGSARKTEGYPSERPSSIG